MISVLTIRAHRIIGTMDDRAPTSLMTTTSTVAHTKEAGDDARGATVVASDDLLAL